MLLAQVAAGQSLGPAEQTAQDAATWALGVPSGESGDPPLPSNGGGIEDPLPQNGGNVSDPTPQLPGTPSIPAPPTVDPLGNGGRDPNQNGGNETGGNNGGGTNQTGNQTGGNQTGGNHTGGNHTGGNHTGGTGTNQGGVGTNAGTQGGADTGGGWWSSSQARLDLDPSHEAAYRRGFGTLQATANASGAGLVANASATVDGDASDGSAGAKAGADASHAGPPGPPKAPNKVPGPSALLVVAALGGLALALGRRR